MILQIADVVFPAFEIPNWVFRTLLLVLAVGFPIALVIAWIFKITPKGGISRDTPYMSYQAQSELQSLPEPELEVIREPALSLEMSGAERRLVSILNCSFRSSSLDGDDADPEFYTGHWPVIAAVLALWSIAHTAALLRYGRPASFHTRLLQTGIGLFALFSVVIFKYGFIPVLLYLAGVVSFAGGIETPDVHGGIRQALQLRAEKSAAE